MHSANDGRRKTIDLIAHEDNDAVDFQRQVVQVHHDEQSLAQSIAHISPTFFVPLHPTMRPPPPGRHIAHNHRAI